MKPKKQTKLDVPVCHEVQIHYKRPVFDTRKNISSSEGADALLKDFADLKRIDLKEFFWVILLTSANQVIGISEVSVGSSRGVVINYREILQLALLTNASALIIAHNHPAGRLKPSEADLKTTKELIKVTKVLEITLLDHLIISSEGYYSLADNGQL